MSRVREIIYLSLHCHHQNDFCIKMGSDENGEVVNFLYDLTQNEV